MSAEIPYVKRAEGLVKNELSDNLSGWPRDMIERLATECVRIVEGQRTAAGYHVVPDAIYRRMRHGDELLAQVEDGSAHVVTEGQAVLTGRVWTIQPRVELENWPLIGVTLRPLTDPPPPPDETTSTTTTEPRA